ncbi:uncharacterized protein MONBRDRAFT_32988 [Monosiga brevicollis MX1]|uniref:Uncharacterized protein n=1 Tax=Monosiga brevicollis TaxID=81824 RepID=A9V2W4_MONBE|nr:uncharacterized protein MONBRDRAFT_32988 [Monosiga brevicollis MX1]EDQ87956.1 predicted protein [Monosiga brevicollis MX1]|eukprot:XP_001747032.1 hypothetical protein [Monosiga brevicollis MX1]
MADRRRAMSDSEAGKKVALVTGGSRGIGAATCRLLGAEGYAVAINYRSNKAEAEKVKGAVEAAGGKAIIVQADVSRAEDVQRMFREVDEQLGPLTALVNNAGIMGKKGPLSDLAPADIEAIFATNAFGPIMCCQEAQRRMSTKLGGHGGAIVNVSSGSAYIGTPNRAVLYGTTKGALNSFTIGFSQEVAKEGIRVNTVSPGFTSTDMVADVDAEHVAKAIPMGRPAAPDEIAQNIVYLLSDKASYVSGANLRVGGGRQ